MRLARAKGAWAQYGQARRENLWGFGAQLRNLSSAAGAPVRRALKGIAALVRLLARWLMLAGPSGSRRQAAFPVDGPVRHTRRDGAQPLRRSVAGQVEYWATLGRSVEHSGLTTQEAQAAIEGYEAAAREVTPKAPDSLEALKLRVLVASSSAILQAHIRTVIEDNLQQAAAVQRAAA